MTKVYVNLFDVESIEGASKLMLNKGENLCTAIEAVAKLFDRIETKIKQVQKNKINLENTLPRLEETIRIITAKIEKVQLEIVATESELAITPKVIVTPKSICRNPHYEYLLLKKSQLTGFKNELVNAKAQCASKKTLLQDDINYDNNMINVLNQYIEFLNDFRIQLKNTENKISRNSEKAINLLKQIEEIINAYLNVKPPLKNVALQRKDIVQKVDSGVIIPGKSGTFWAKEVGNYGEMRTSVEFRNQGYLEMTESPKTLDEKIKHGIDHVFYKNDTIFVVDSKSGAGAHLEPMTATGPQLSDTWIDARLDGTFGKDTADLIRERMIFEPDSVVRLVSKVDIGENTIYQLVNEFGAITKEAMNINDLPFKR